MTTKQFSLLVGITIIVLAVWTMLLFVPSTQAQGVSSGLIMLNPQTSLANCSWPTAYATVTNGMALCPLNLSTGPAIALAVNGGAFTQVPMASAAPPVASVFGRTGTVVATQGDYSYGQLSSPPTTLSCSTASIATGSSGTLTASGCSLK